MSQAVGGGTHTPNSCPGGHNKSPPNLSKQARLTGPHTSAKIKMATARKGRLILIGMGGQSVCGGGEREGVRKKKKREGEEKQRKLD